MINTTRKFASLASDPRVRGAGMRAFASANLGNQSTL
jgi:hypothetical protein